MKEITFLKAVVKECENIKKLTTKEEKNKLNTDMLNPSWYTTCIYGQMTGHCSSGRAKELINECCSLTVVNDAHEPTISLQRVCTVAKRGAGAENRMLTNVKFYSELEAYILTADANNAKILSFIKGQLDTLTIEDLKTKQLN